jgi:Fic family protein
MIERPPKLTMRALQTALNRVREPEIKSVLEPINDRYLYWSEIKYRNRPENMSAEELWALVMLSRQMLGIYTWPKYNVLVTVTNQMQRLCHEFDMNFGGAWGNSAVIPDQDREKYLVSSLMEEAISSSQMEGASTTRKVAKDMLKRNIPPKTRSEQMIYNNYTAIRFITEHKDEPMSESLLLQIHRLMTENTLDNPNEVGQFRKDDNVVVQNSLTGEIVHTPPSYAEIPEFIGRLNDFLNKEEEAAFIHPIIKALTAHFMIAYIHPFVDGNGRTARAVFYWYMLKKGYWLTEYLSISRIIYRTKNSYEKAFLYAENDRMDIGYFLSYNLRVLDLAFKELKDYIQRKITQKQKAVDFLKLGFVNERQAAILAMVRDDPRIILSISDICAKFQVSQPTAKADIDKLVERGLLERVQVNGRQFNYVKGEKYDTDASL